MSTVEPKLEDSNQQNSFLRIALVAALMLIAAGALLVTTVTPDLGQEADSGPAEDVTPSSSAATVTLPESGDPLTIGDRPYAFSLQHVDGQTVQLSNFIGQPIIINFWATWCAPCRIEMPELQAAFQRHKEDGLVLLALNQDETPEQAAAFFEELGLTFTPLLDVANQTSQNYGVGRTLPTTFFINPEGEITAIHRGLMVKQQLDGYLAQTIPGLQ